jgi:hypothetical protein
MFDITINSLIVWWIKVFCLTHHSIKHAFHNVVFTKINHYNYNIIFFLQKNNYNIILTRGFTKKAIILWNETWIGRKSYAWKIWNAKRCKFIKFIPLVKSLCNGAPNFATNNSFVALKREVTRVTMEAKRKVQLNLKPFSTNFIPKNNTHCSLSSVLHFQIRD